ncbi:Uncharacterized protein FWK35_00003606, partial [Aphis craccivora]
VHQSRKWGISGEVRFIGSCIEGILKPSVTRNTKTKFFQNPRGINSAFDQTLNKSDAKIIAPGRKRIESKCLTNRPVIVWFMRDVEAITSEAHKIVILIES